MGDYDTSTKWLLEHFGRSLLRLAGIEDVVTCQSLQSEVVLPRKLPDGLLKVKRAGKTQPDLFLVEVATYADRRLYDQLVEGSVLAYLNRPEPRVLPEVVAIILRPKGRFRLSDSLEIGSPLGLASWRFGWRVVELWKLPAERLLEAGDPGLIPWVPLARTSRSPEEIVETCRAEIEAKAPDEERAGLLSITQTLVRLVYPEHPRLWEILGGTETMLELPFLKELEEELRRKLRGELRGELLAEGQLEAARTTLLRQLRRRFGELPEETPAIVEATSDLDRLAHWLDLVVTAERLEDIGIER